jgi:hypothetical protein
MYLRFSPGPLHLFIISPLLSPSPSLPHSLVFIVASVVLWLWECFVWSSQVQPPQPQTLQQKKQRQPPQRQRQRQQPVVPTSSPAMLSTWSRSASESESAHMVPQLTWTPPTRPLTHFDSASRAATFTLARAVSDSDLRHIVNVPNVYVPPPPLESPTRRPPPPHPESMRKLQKDREQRKLQTELAQQLSALTQAPPPPQ